MPYYVGPGGEPVHDDATLRRIRSLAIPPAWSDVWICPLANGHLQATGRDDRGRKQYRYHPRWRAAEALLDELAGTLRVTMHPQLIAPAALAPVDTLIATGDTPAEMLNEFCQAVADRPLALGPVGLAFGPGLVFGLAYLIFALAG